MAVVWYVCGGSNGESKMLQVPEVAAGTSTVIPHIVFIDGQGSSLNHELTVS